VIPDGDGADGHKDLISLFMMNKDDVEPFENRMHV